MLTCKRNYLQQYFSLKDLFGFGQSPFPWLGKIPSFSETFRFMAPLTLAAPLPISILQCKVYTIVYILQYSKDVFSVTAACKRCHHSTLLITFRMLARELSSIIIWVTVGWVIVVSYSRKFSFSIVIQKILFFSKTDELSLEHS